MTEAFIHTARAEPRACPVCQRICDAATGVSLDPADPCPEIQIGDITSCAYCGTALVVTTLGFRPATTDDLARLPAPLRQLIFDHAATHQFKKI